MKNIKGYKELLMESMDKKELNDELLNASMFEGPKTVERLLDMGADPNTKGPNGCTPLHNSALRGNEHITQMLIDRGADVNARNDSGEPPIHKAAFNGSIETLRVLLNSGADPNAIDTDSKFFPLKWAVVRANVDAVRLLIERGADPNKIDWTGKTPIFQPFDYQHEWKNKSKRDVIEALLKGGADPTKKDRIGRSALSLAKQEDPVVLQAILTHSRDVLKNFDWKEIVDAFGGNEADVPEEVSARWNRMKRGKSAFGM